jgi:hypothetical protein
VTPELPRAAGSGAASAVVVAPPRCVSLRPISVHIALPLST